MAVSEYRIMHNPSLGAHAIWEFSNTYKEFNEDHQYPVLMLTLPVLPLVLNKRASDRIKGKNFKEGSLARAIAEDRAIYGGLQDRMESLYELTLLSINVAASSGLIIYDPESTQLISNRKTELNLDLGKDYQDILKSARRIGAWFGQLSLSEIMMYFSIKF